jgi:hypothetical protein
MPEEHEVVLVKFETALRTLQEELALSLSSGRIEKNSRFHPGGNRPGCPFAPETLYRLLATSSGAWLRAARFLQEYILGGNEICGIGLRIYKTGLRELCDDLLNDARFITLSPTNSSVCRRS